MKKAFIIENPVATSSNPRGLETVTSALASAGFATSVGTTESHGHARELAREAVATGVDLIAVYGGDGTIMQAVDGMFGSGIPLGIIPGGTGNLLAGNLRIPKNPAKAADIIANGTPRTIDLGRLENDAGSRYFAVACGSGYDADMVAETTHESKKRLGIVAYVTYVIRTAHRIRPAAYRVTVDGKSEDFEAASVLVANCGEALPRLLPLGPDVRIDDGILDVIVLTANSFLSVAIVVLQMFRQRDSRWIRRIRGTEVRIEAREPRVVQADGDACGHTPFSASMVPASLVVMTPKASS